MGQRTNKPRRRGRRKDVKNLQRTETGFVNQHGVTITAEERKELERLVARANYKRKKQLAAQAELPRMVAGKPTGTTQGSLQVMGWESDLIITRKSKSLQRFATREGFEYYMSHLKDVLAPDYEQRMIRQYKKNYLKGLLEHHGGSAMDIYMKVRMMKPEEFMNVVHSNEEMEIKAYYPTNEAEGVGIREGLRATLGMKSKE